MLFVYGRLQDPDVLAAVLGRTLDPALPARAHAPDHRAIAYPALVPAPGDSAPGLVLDGLDAFEGAEYRRDGIDIMLAGAAIRAAAYLPAIALAPSAPAWSLTDRTLRHKPAVIGHETGTARAMRQHLAALQSR